MCGTGTVIKLLPNSIIQSKNMKNSIASCFIETTTNQECIQFTIKIIFCAFRMLMVTAECLRVKFTAREIL